MHNTSIQISRRYYYINISIFTVLVTNVLASLISRSPDCASTRDQEPGENHREIQTHKLQRDLIYITPILLHSTARNDEGYQPPPPPLPVNEICLATCSYVPERESTVS